MNDWGFSTLVTVFEAEDQLSEKGMALRQRQAIAVISILLSFMLEHLPPSRSQLVLH